MCYHSGVVSFPTDTVGHAVGVLGVGLLDTDWTSWAGRCWSLWLLPACESLGGGSLSSRGSLDRSPFSILTTLLSASRAKILPSLVQVLLTALCLLTRSSRSLFSGVRSSTIVMPHPFKFLRAWITSILCRLDTNRTMTWRWYPLENWPTLWATLTCCFVMCPSFSFSLIITSTLSSHCIVVSLLLSEPSSTKRRFSRLPYCSRSFLLSHSTSSLLRRVDTSSCRASRSTSSLLRRVDTSSCRASRSTSSLLRRVVTSSCRALHFLLDLCSLSVRLH